MKHQVLIVIFISLKLISATKDEKVEIHRFKSLTCSPGDAADIIRADLCEVLPNGALDMSYTLLRPVTDAFVQLTSFVKSGKVFRQLFQSPTIDYCGFMAGSTSNVLLKSLIDQVQSDSKIFHKCPYEGVIEMKNFDIKDEKFFTIYPSGDYKSIIKFFPTNPPNLTYFATVIWETTIKSPMKLG